VLNFIHNSKGAVERGFAALFYFSGTLNNRRNGLENAVF